MQEASLLRRIRHPNVIQFFGVSMTGGVEAAGSCFGMLSRGSGWVVLHASRGRDKGCCYLISPLLASSKGKLITHLSEGSTLMQPESTVLLVACLPACRRARVAADGAWWQGPEARHAHCGEQGASLWVVQQGPPHSTPGEPGVRPRAR